MNVVRTMEMCYLGQLYMCRSGQCIQHLRTWTVLCRQEKFGSVALPQIALSEDGRVSEELCASAVMTADKLKVAIVSASTLQTSCKCAVGLVCLMRLVIEVVLGFPRVKLK